MATLVGIVLVVWIVASYLTDESEAGRCHGDVDGVDSQGDWFGYEYTIPCPEEP